MRFGKCYNPLLFFGGCPRKVAFEDFFMNEREHVFPLPEFELHKLEEVKEEIVHPTVTAVRRFLTENTWTALTIAAGAGLLCGLVLGRRG